MSASIYERNGLESEYVKERICEEQEARALEKTGLFQSVFLKMINHQ